jgi:hypothetical protein
MEAQLPSAPKVSNAFPQNDFLALPLPLAQIKVSAHFHA